MFIPIVPSVSHTTVINKTIVYSDTVLSLKDSGNNLKITSIENVSESSLENCLKIIFESNPDVIFNTIQYSKNNNKIYFYTNKEITTKAYEESKFTNYKPLTSRTEILEEVKNVLLSPKNKDSNCISLYDVLLLLKRLNSKYNNIVKEYDNKLSYLVKNKIDDDCLIYFHGLDYENKNINIRFTPHYSIDWKDIYFAKQNGDLYVTKSESCYTNEIFSALSSTLSEAYDELLKYEDYKNDKYTHPKAVNSNFDIRISNSSICLSAKDFELSAPCYKDNYELDCNSSIINETISGKKTEIFKKIFVKISDCPEWSQSTLYEIRKNQLIEEQKIEDELKYKEMKMQKRLALKRKIFPFLKEKK